MIEQTVSEEWHGYAVGDKQLHIGRLPGRKQVCLYIQNGGSIYTVAFFKTEAIARETLLLLDGIAQGRVLDY